MLFFHLMQNPEGSNIVFFILTPNASTVLRNMHK